MSVVMSKVSNAGMKFTKLSHCLFAVLAALLFTGYASAESPHGRQFTLEISRVGLLTPFGCCQERLQTDIDSHGGVPVGRDLNVAKIAREDNKPLAALFFESSGFDFSLGEAVLLNFHFANVLNSEAPIFETNAVSMARKFYRIETVFGFKSRVSRLVAKLNSTEKSLKCFVESAHRSLCATEIQFGKPLIGSPLVFVPRRLIAVADGGSVFLVSYLALFQASIIQPAMSFKHHQQFAFLITIGVKSKSKCLAHLLSICLIESKSSKAGTAGDAAFSVV